MSLRISLHVNIRNRTRRVMGVIGLGRPVGRGIRDRHRGRSPSDESLVHLHRLITNVTYHPASRSGRSKDGTVVHIFVISPSSKGNRITRSKVYVFCFVSEVFVFVDLFVLFLLTRIRTKFGNTKLGQFSIHLSAKHQEVR